MKPLADWIKRKKLQHQYQTDLNNRLSQDMLLRRYLQTELNAIKDAQMQIDRKTATWLEAQNRYIKNGNPQIGE